MKNFPKLQNFSTVQFLIKKRNKRFLGFGHLKLISMVAFSLKALDWSIINQRPFHLSLLVIQDIPRGHPSHLSFLLFMPLQSEHTTNPTGGQSSLKCAPRDPSRNQEVNIKHVWKDEGLTKMALSSSDQLSWVYVTVDGAKYARWFFFATPLSLFVIHSLNALPASWANTLLQIR